jgi:hypothetical protein
MWLSVTYTTCIYAYLGFDGGDPSVNHQGTMVRALYNFTIVRVVHSMRNLTMVRTVHSIHNFCVSLWM